MNKRRSIILSLVIAVLVGAAWFGYAHRSAIRECFFSTNADLPAAVNRTNAVQNTNTNASVNSNSNSNAGVNGNTNGTSNSNTNMAEQPLPKEYNLNVAFTSQAPDANWDQDHDEFCEEAAVLMVGRYWQDRGFKDKADAEAALQEIKSWEVEHLGFYYDTTAAETASILTGMYDLTYDLVEDPTVTMIKRAVVSGNPVIVPTNGRMLGNPNFRSPGPVYHNLVIKGYTDDGKFITNDPGTRKGADYVYDESVVMDAMHDWAPNADRTKPGNGSSTGRKVIIIAHGT